MKEKKNIDKLFKEQFKDFEVSPKDAVWENIQAELHQDERKKRRIIPIWWRIAGVAAALALIFTVASQLVEEPSETDIPIETVDNNKVKSKSNKDLEDSNITDTDESVNYNETQEIDLADSQVNEAPSEDNFNSSKERTRNDKSAINNTESSVAHHTQSTNSKNSEVVANHSSISANQKESLLKSNPSTLNQSSTEKTVAKSNQDITSDKNNSETVLKNRSEINEIISSENTDVNTIAKSSKTNMASESAESSNENTNLEEIEVETTEQQEAENAIEKAIAEAETEDTELEEEAKESKRWSVSPNIAPVYFSSLGEGSSIDEQFIGNNKETEINMSYGVTGSYAVSKKLKVRAGINRVDMGYTTNDVLIFDNSANTTLARRSSRMANVDMVENLGGYSIFSANNFDFEKGPANLYVQEQGSIDQQLGFIEVPIELEYSLVEKKFGLNLIGGFSTLFLSQNDIFAVLDSGERTRLGDASNVRDLSYTANFGFGIDYNFTKQLQFNFEPTFKYQINTFSNTSGDFQPFFIGMYTGLSFKF